MEKMEWVICPVCGNKTRNRIREDTVLDRCSTIHFWKELCCILFLDAWKIYPNQRLAYIESKGKKI